MPPASSVTGGRSRTVHTKRVPHQAEPFLLPPRVCSGDTGRRRGRGYGQDILSHQGRARFPQLQFGALYLEGTRGLFALTGGLRVNVEFIVSGVLKGRGVLEF